MSLYFNKIASLNFSHDCDSHFHLLMETLQQIFPLLSYHCLLLFYGGYFANQVSDTKKEKFDDIIRLLRDVFQGLPKRYGRVHKRTPPYMNCLTQEVYLQRSQFNSCHGHCQETTCVLAQHSFKLGRTIHSIGIVPHYSRRRYQKGWGWGQSSQQQ